MSKSDGWETQADPVREFVTLRTVQVCTPTLLGLIALARVLPSRKFVPWVPITGTVVTLGLSAYFHMVFDPRTTWGYPLITHLPEGYGNAVALTFDDGPHPATTPELLDILAGQGAMATFFLVAERAKAYPHLTRRIVAEGHTIGVHGLRHRAMVGQSAPALRSELAEAERIFTEILGTPLPHRLLRPPHGFKTPTVCRTAVQEGWQIVSWSFDPHDYDSLTPETLLQRLQTQGKAGDIILLHERPDTPLINQALPSFLRHLHEQGLKTVSLS